jgi:hypothetical protein
MDENTPLTAEAAATDLVLILSAACRLRQTLAGMAAPPGGAAGDFNNRETLLTPNPA